MPKMVQLKNGNFKDRETGIEYDKHEYTNFMEKNRKKLRKKFVMLFQETYIALAKDREIRGETRSILDLMLGMMSFENKIPIHQAKMGEILQIAPCKVSLAIKKLLNKGIIEKDFTEGRNQFYRLNSECGWKGKADNYYIQKIIKVKTIKSE